MPEQPLPTSTVYAGVTLTLATGKNYLWALLKAQDPNIAGFAREVTITADPANGTTAILMGDSAVLDSPKRCAYTLAPGGVRTYRDVKNAAVLANLYAFVPASATGAYLLNFEIMLG